MFTANMPHVKSRNLPRTALRLTGFGALSLLAACAGAGQIAAPQGGSAADRSPGGPPKATTITNQSGPLSVVTSPAPLQFTGPSQNGTVTLVEPSPPNGTVFSLDASDCLNKTVVSVNETDSQHYALTSTATGVQPCKLVASDGINNVTVTVNPTWGSGKFVAPTPIAQQPLGTNKIQHVVIIIQENRSFDNLFNGYPGADTVQVADNLGTPVTLQPQVLEGPLSPGHYHHDFYKSFDGGKMDDFTEAAGNSGNPLFPFSYVPKSETGPYWTLAQNYTLADRMFQSNGGASFAAHMFLIAGQALTIADTPVVPHVQAPTAWGCDDAAGTTVTLIGTNGGTKPGPYPCFDFLTLADQLDAKSLSWRYYAASTATSTSGVWSNYDAIRHVRFSTDWTTKVISPETNILTDVAGSSGVLANVTWVVPEWQNSDHPGAGNTGPQWVASIVNAIGTSQFWNSTAIFLVWDDWGGWYDHVVPPQLDTEGLGFRVPLVVISPYAKHAYVSHVVHEFGSILRFAEEDFGLAAMAPSDTRADDLRDCFDFTQSPQPYSPIPTLLHTAQQFQNAPRGPLGPEVEY